MTKDDLEGEIRRLRFTVNMYAEEAAKGSHACKHCRTILDWHSAPMATIGEEAKRQFLRVTATPIWDYIDHARLRRDLRDEEEGD